MNAAELRRRLRAVLRERSKAARIAAGVLLVAGGLLGFLPVLGFWMIPLGLAVLSYDFPPARRAWVGLRLWWRSRRNGPLPPGASTAGDEPG